jgi:MFS family permease
MGAPGEAASGARAWMLVGGIAGGQLVSWGIVYYGFSLFVLPMERDLGWDRTDLNGALSLGLLAMAVAAYPVGAWIDRHGGHWVMLVGAALSVALLLCWGRVESLAAFRAVWIGLGACMAATLYEPAFAMLNWMFRTSFRQKIAAVTLVGGFASTVFMPITQLLVDALGWRAALDALALIVALTVVPIHAWLAAQERRRPPPSVDLAPRRAGWPVLREAARRPVFWALFVSFTCYAATFTAMTFHLVPLLGERGLPQPLVIAAISVIGPAQVAARSVLITVARRAPTRTVGLIVVVAMPLAVTLLWAAPGSIIAVFLFAVVYGGANGLFTIVRSAVVPDMVQRDGYATVNGALAVPQNLAKAAGPIAAAAIWELAGGYDRVLLTVIAGAMVSAVAFWIATRVATPRHLQT